MEFSLLGAVLVGVIGAYATLRYEAGRTNAADCTRDVWDALLTASVAGLVAGRVAHMIGAGTNPLSNPGDLLIVRGGVSTLAASVAGLLTFALVVRRDLWGLADAAAPAAVAGLAGWRGGCLVRDSCLGSPTDLPWAWAQPGSTVGRHPVEVYAALLLVLTTIALLLWKRRRRPAGLVAAAAITSIAVARLATEPLRLGIGSDQTWFYAAATTGGLALLVWRRTAEPPP